VAVAVAVAVEVEAEVRPKSGARPKSAAAQRVSIPRLAARQSGSTEREAPVWRARQAPGWAAAGAGRSR
jgi:hypothetical protein